MSRYLGDVCHQHNGCVRYQGQQAGHVWGGESKIMVTHFLICVGFQSVESMDTLTGHSVGFYFSYMYRHTYTGHSVGFIPHSLNQSVCKRA